MKRKMLIASGGYADIPIIQSAKRLGYFVITSGRDRDGLGNRYSDLYCKADNSDKDAILAVAKMHRVDAICPGAAGLSGVSCSYAAEKLGLKWLDSYENSRVLHYKDRFRKFAEENGILIPRSGVFNSIKAANAGYKNFRFPLIFKPVDRSGGKGISRVADRRGVKAAIAHAFSKSPAKAIMIEEFIEGTNHGLSAIIRRGKAAFYFSDNEYYYKNKYLVAGAYAPGSTPDKAVKFLVMEIEKIASILELKDGIFHLQYILRGEKPYIIDVCRRIPGDLYVNFVKYSTGVDYPAAIVKAFTGMKMDGLRRGASDIFCTRHVVMASRNGIFKRVTFADEIKDNVFDKFMILNAGSRITDFMTQKIGIVFLRYDSKEESDDKNRRIHELIRTDGGGKRL